MPKTEEILVPDIGDFDSVEIVEVLVSPGDAVEVEDPLITLESDKATMEVPSPLAGKVVDKIGPTRVIQVALVITLIGLIIYSFIHLRTNYVVLLAFI